MLGLIRKETTKQQRMNVLCINVHACLDYKHNIDFVVLHVLLRSLKKCFKFVFKIRGYSQSIKMFCAQFFIQGIIHVHYFKYILELYMLKWERDSKKYDCLNEINLQIFVIFYRVVFVLQIVTRTGLFESFYSLTYHLCVDI